MRSVLLFAILALLPAIYHAKFLDRLTYGDLYKVVGPTPTLLIFTVKWCQHCQEAQSEIAVLANAVKNVPDITVARVDGDEEPAIAQKFAVQSFPSFLFMRKGFDIDRNDQPEEFSDYRWAELMAEFVNNETKSELIKVEPRKQFLTWRKKVPYNKGKQPREIVHQEETPTPHPEGLDPIQGAEEQGMTVRDPIILNEDDFEQTVIKNTTESFLVYFYTKNDPMQRETLIEWRQAGTAFPPDEHVIIAMVNIENGDNNKLAERYKVTDTPAALYFGRCNTEEAKKDGYVCKKPTRCETCEDTNKIVSFIADRMMAEAGLGMDSGGAEPMELTEEQFRKLQQEGKVISSEDKMNVAQILNRHEPTKPRSCVKDGIEERVVSYDKLPPTNKDGMIVEEDKEEL